MKVAGHILLAFNLFVWAALTLLGVDYLWDRIAAAHYQPSVMGVAWLVGIPVTALALVIRVAAKLHQNADALFGVSIFVTFSTLVAGVIYLMPLGGGM